MPKSVSESSAMSVSEASAGTPPPASSRRNSAHFASRVASLHRKLSIQNLETLEDASMPAAKRRRTAPAEAGPVHVPACASCCPADAQCDPSDGQQQQQQWCDHDVAIPSTDWPAVMQAVGGGGAGSSSAAVADAEPGADGLHRLPGGITVRVTTRPEQLPAALAALRASMADSVVAIDMEWRPDGFGGGGGSSRVALMQLASSSHVLLVRLCRMGFALPLVLAAFLRDPGLAVVAYGWEGADEAKARLTFGAGRASLFRRFLDLQAVSATLGYHGYGLASLTRQVRAHAPMPHAPPPSPEL